MATLAEHAAALRVRVSFVMIHMSNGQNDFAAGNGMRLAICGAAIWILWGSFTAEAGSLQQRPAKLFPFRRMSTAAGIILPLFRTDRHYGLPFQCAANSAAIVCARYGMSRFPNLMSVRPSIE